MSKEKYTKRNKKNPVYLDCAATTPLDPVVREVFLHYIDEEYGNAGSRTHEYGARALRGVQLARDQVVTLAKCQREEVIFTSGATEANNLAILGLAEKGIESGKRHIISTCIEHKAVLEPLQEMVRRGFEVTLLPPNATGWVSSEQVAEALRSDTLLVSTMHANNETGTIQPIEEMAMVLDRHSAFWHVDASQTFGKLIEPLRNPRIDLIAASAHKLYGPKGVGSLIARRRGYEKLPIKPLVFGGGQERGLRPGTVPVPLVAAWGEACALAVKEAEKRANVCCQYREKVLDALRCFSIKIHGDPGRSLPHILNFSIEGIDSEAVMVAVKNFIAISNGSACTSSSYQPSHVLAAMGLSSSEIEGAIRLSWSHLTPDADWESVVALLREMI